MNNNLVTKRIVVGKSTGFVLGLFSFFALVIFMPSISPHFKWGLLFWYTTMGAIIGMSGVIIKVPLFNWSLSGWIRAIIIGAWLNCVLLLLAYNTVYALITGVYPDKGFYVSSYWFVLEGALVGLIIEYVISKLTVEKAT